MDFIYFYFSTNRAPKTSSGLGMVQTARTCAYKKGNAQGVGRRLFGPTQPTKPASSSFFYLFLFFY
jgi:hypothetical protein